MKKHGISILTGGCILIAGMISSVAAEEKADITAAKALFETKCSMCHTTARATSANKTRADWESTVMRMKNSNGAPISEDEAQMIINFLAGEFGE